MRGYIAITNGGGWARGFTPSVAAETALHYSGGYDPVGMKATVYSVQDMSKVQVDPFGRLTWNTDETDEPKLVETHTVTQVYSVDQDYSDEGYLLTDVVYSTDVKEV